MGISCGGFSLHKRGTIRAAAESAILAHGHRSAVPAMIDNSRSAINTAQTRRDVQCQISYAHAQNNYFDHTH